MLIYRLKQQRWCSVAAADLSRKQLCEQHRKDEESLIRDYISQRAITSRFCQKTSARALELVEALRRDGKPGLMEVFFEEYGLSTQEGLALMCLAEALLRVPDPDTMDALIADKVVPATWSEHLGHSNSTLVNASTWGLLLTSRVLNDEQDAGPLGLLHGAVRRLGEPVIRAAVKRAMAELGAQFVLGQTIEEAMQRGSSAEQNGYTFSYDMLGEAALTMVDADAYLEKYEEAIQAIAERCVGEGPQANPGISIKLSALHPRYEASQQDRVVRELTPRVRRLAMLARSSNMGFTIDAEEADRLDLSLDIIERVFSDPGLADWAGFGVVVQAYGKRASALIEWLYALARRHGRGMMIRLVKGAYWDAEIKQAQVDGVENFPVFTSKAATDASYICCAKSLLEKTDWLYPQFATHNAHTMAAILELSADRERFEFQRLHGMGGGLHELVKNRERTRCRIYAPAGMHRDLLAYLVRRLLENGANSSFVNQMADPDIPASQIAADPFAAVQQQFAPDTGPIKKPAALFLPERINSRGWNLRNRDDLSRLDDLRGPFQTAQWQAAPDPALGPNGNSTIDIINPADAADKVGAVTETTPAQLAAALRRAVSWTDLSLPARAETLNRAADIYEANSGEFLAVLCREAGKTLADAIAELREAVDFLRYYAAQALRMGAAQPRGLFTCISPWNFPLAIFTGQIAAALVTGNGVLAKPAETTPLTAMLAVRHLHAAGVPSDVLQLLPGTGREVGALLTAAPEISGVCFTGSTQTARSIHRMMASTLSPGAPLIAETGGINAMIVDSTALPEQAVRDIITSAFQSAGQRCSALRMLYLQEDIAEPFLEMLTGAMKELSLGDPWRLSTDIGPLISGEARRGIEQYVAARREEHRILYTATTPNRGHFVSPTIVKVDGIGDLEREIFGPVLHVASWRPQDIENVIRAINASGYGLTFGLHSRIDARGNYLKERINAGNLYVNRNQIGAVPGSQPFGGEGLSGTGPKAGGPRYLQRFIAPPQDRPARRKGPVISNRQRVQALINKMPKLPGIPCATIAMPGPTGETNQWSNYPRGQVLCLGPALDQAREQAEIARFHGCRAVLIAADARGPDSLPGVLSPSVLGGLEGLDIAAYWADDELAAAYRQALAAREGPIIPLVTGRDLAAYCTLERHLCINTTAAGGNAALLAGLS